METTKTLPSHSKEGVSLKRKPRKKGGQEMTVPEEILGITDPFYRVSSQRLVVVFLSNVSYSICAQSLHPWAHLGAVKALSHYGNSWITFYRIMKETCVRDTIMVREQRNNRCRKSCWCCRTTCFADICVNIWETACHTEERCWLTLICSSIRTWPPLLQSLLAWLASTSLPNPGPCWYRRHYSINLIYSVIVLRKW